MEINATVYAVANDRVLLKEAGEILCEKKIRGFQDIRALEPCAVLPLSRTWYWFTSYVDMTGDPDEWLDCLEDCAKVLLKNGAVVVEFNSPDFPDYYPEYAYTTSGGSSGSAKRCNLEGYARATGNRDISMAISELLRGRSEQEREYASRKKERKEAVRREKGDFEITPDGVLKRYRGHDVNVVIPDGVREIGDSAFVDMKDLERMIVDCEDDYDAPEMETLVIPDSVEVIHGYAFAYCLNLVSVEMADSVREIGDRAFEGCRIQKVCIPASVTEIGEDAFPGGTKVARQGE